MIAACLVASVVQQQPVFDAAEYVRAHASADTALVAGELATCEAFFRQCLSLSPTNPTVAYGLACVSARSGSQRAALYWLETAVRWGYCEPELVPWDDDLSCVREDLRFGAAVARMRESGCKPFDLDTLRVIRDPQATACVFDVAVDDAGTKCVVGQNDGVVRVLSACDGHELAPAVQLGSAVWAVAIDAAGERFAALTWDGRVRVRGTAANSVELSWDALGPPARDHLGWPFGALLQFDPSDRRLLVAGGERPMGLWTADGRAIASWESPGYFFAVPVAWSESGNLLAIPRDETVELFDGRTGAASNAALDTPSPLRSVALSPDERWLATGHADNRVRVWNLATRALAVDHRFDDIFDAALDVNAVAFAPDGGRLAASTGEIAYLDVLEVPSGTVLRHFGWSGGHFGEPFELRWSRDGARLWFPFVCGSMPCDEMVFDARAACPKWRGRSPRVSRAGIGIATTLGGVLALDTGSLRCLWYRPILGRDGELVQTPAGYFTATVAQLDGLAIHADTIGGSPSPSLLDVAADSFDPKRVRASCAGVRLSLPRF